MVALLKPRVLVVDDDEQIARMIALVLHTQGCVSSIAYSGAQALSKFNESDVDVIITDVSMAWGDGISFIQAIRRQSEVPVIIISAVATKYSEEIRLLDRVSFLPKPINLEDLAKCVLNACGPSRDGSTAQPATAETNDPSNRRPPCTNPPS